MAQVAAISQQIWDMKYRLKGPDGAPVDKTIEDSWRRVATAVVITNTRQGGTVTVTLTGKPYACTPWAADGPASIAVPTTPIAAQPEAPVAHAARPPAAIPVPPARTTPPPIFSTSPAVPTMRDS